MCGIVGWFAGKKSRVSRPVLEKMTRKLALRGPDGEGFYVKPAVGFGHRRLSIVDIGGGAQPMTNADESVVVTFNGEIYNYLELRRDLEKLGHHFRTRSDTEVLVHGYAQWGEHLPSHLNGMFAFAIWDAKKKSAFLSRDRFGKKPLYYSLLDDGTLLFASEIKALLEHPGVSRQMDVTAIALYLSLEYVPYPYSAFAGIRKLAPSESLEWKNGEISVSRYFESPFPAEPDSRSDREWFAQTREALSAATKRRLMADVPLGVFLSGGIDSSAIVACMAEHVPAPEIQTFSISFDDASFDESKWSQMVAGHFGTNHRERKFSPDELLATIPKVGAYLDEPFADSSVLPTYLLSGFTREHVTVALGGDGGDELFMGYETFRAEQAARLWHYVPAAARGSVKNSVDRMPVDVSNFSLDFVLKSFLRGADARPEFRHTRWLSAFLPHTDSDPLRRELRDAIPDGQVFGVMARPYLECAANDTLQKHSYSYIRSYLCDDILTKVDRASMANSLEVRAPFLDPEMYSLVARMPSHLKLRGLSAKFALKKAMENDLPHEILYRKKKGFGIPIAKWLNGPLAPEVDRLLAPSRIADGGLLDAEVVSRVVAEHRQGRRDNRKQIWTLMMLETWRESFDAKL